MLLYHHCIPLEHIVHGELRADPFHSDPEFKDAYAWLAKEVCFHPLFLAVGATEEDIRMTGYQDNWRVRTSSWYEDGKLKGKYRRAGGFPNHALF